MEWHVKTYPGSITQDKLKDTVKPKGQLLIHKMDTLKQMKDIIKLPLQIELYYIDDYIPYTPNQEDQKLEDSYANTQDANYQGRIIVNQL